MEGAPGQRGAAPGRPQQMHGVHRWGGPAPQPARRGHPEWAHPVLGWRQGGGCQTCGARGGWGRPCSAVASSCRPEEEVWRRSDAAVGGGWLEERQLWPCNGCGLSASRAHSPACIWCPGLSAHATLAAQGLTACPEPILQHNIASAPPFSTQYLGPFSSLYRTCTCLCQTVLLGPCKGHLG